MEKEFVTYEIALKLQELGFDEPCFAHYISNQGWKIDCKEGSFYYKGSPSNSKDEYSILAPLWQQVLDWFRYAHKTDIGIYPCFVYNNHYNYEIIINRDFDNALLGNNSKKLSYEEAREQGILKAIDIINN